MYVNTSANLETKFLDDGDVFKKDRKECVSNVFLTLSARNNTYHRSNNLQVSDGTVYKMFLISRYPKMDRHRLRRNLHISRSSFYCSILKAFSNSCFNRFLKIVCIHSVVNVANYC